MKIFNTLTHQVEEFIPNEEGKVKMYTCGPTVYNFAHIGNLRTYIFEDILEKTLRYLGYEVTRCMNITDVGHLSSDSDSGEDKMVAGAKKEHKSVLEIAKFYTEAFKEDPVRILRIARFSAKLPEFTIAPETFELLKTMVQNGEADTLVAERVFLEMRKTFREKTPSRFITVLQSCGLWQRFFKNFNFSAVFRGDFRFF